MGLFRVQLHIYKECVYAMINDHHVTTCHWIQEFKTVWPEILPHIANIVSVLLILRVLQVNKHKSWCDDVYASGNCAKAVETGEQVTMHFVQCECAVREAVVVAYEPGKVVIIEDVAYEYLNLRYG